MKWFYNFKISKKLISGFSIVALITCFVGVYGILRIININDNDTRLYMEGVKPLGNIAEISTQFQRIRVNVRNAVIDPANSKTYSDKIEEYYKDIDNYAKEYEKGISNEEERKEYNNL